MASYVVAVWTFTGDASLQQLSFPEGTLLHLDPSVTAPQGWSYGVCEAGGGSGAGYFPLNFTEAYDPQKHVNVCPAAQEPQQPQTYDPQPQTYGTQPQDGQVYPGQENGYHTPEPVTTEQVHYDGAEYPQEAAPAEQYYDGQQQQQGYYDEGCQQTEQQYPTEGGGEYNNCEYNTTPEQPQETVSYEEQPPQTGGAPYGVAGRTFTRPNPPPTHVGRAYARPAPMGSTGGRPFPKPSPVATTTPVSPKPTPTPTNNVAGRPLPTAGTPFAKPSPPAGMGRPTPGPMSPGPSPGPTGPAPTGVTSPKPAPMGHNPAPSVVTGPKPSPITTNPTPMGRPTPGPMNPTPSVVTSPKPAPATTSFSPSGGPTSPTPRPLPVTTNPTPTSPGAKGPLPASAGAMGSPVSKPAPFGNNPTPTIPKPAPGTGNNVGARATTSQPLGRDLINAAGSTRGPTSPGGRNHAHRVRPVSTFILNSPPPSQPSIRGRPVGQPIGNGPAQETKPQQPLAEPVLYAEALYDYTGDSSKNIFSFSKGAMIEIKAKNDSGWWTGMLDGVLGYFPSNFVKEVAAPTSPTKRHSGYGNGGFYSSAGTVPLGMEGTGRVFPVGGVGTVISPHKRVEENRRKSLGAPVSRSVMTKALNGQQAGPGRGPLGFSSPGNGNGELLPVAPTPNGEEGGKKKKGLFSALKIKRKADKSATQQL